MNQSYKKKVANRFYKNNHFQKRFLFIFKLKTSGSLLLKTIICSENKTIVFEKQLKNETKKKV